LEICGDGEMLRYLILLVPTLVFGQANVSVTWDANTESDLSHYNIYLWDISKFTINPDSTSNEFMYFDTSKLDSVSKIANLRVTTVTWQNVSPVGGFFITAVSAVDSSGNESLATGILFQLKENDIIAPRPPSGVTIGIILIGMVGGLTMLLIFFMIRRLK